MSLLYLRQPSCSHSLRAAELGVGFFHRKHQPGESPAAVLRWLQPGSPLPDGSLRTPGSPRLRPAAALGSKPLPRTRPDGGGLERASLRKSLLRWRMPSGSFCLNMAIQGFLSHKVQKPLFPMVWIAAVSNADFCVKKKKRKKKTARVGKVIVNIHHL